MNSRKTKILCTIGPATAGVNELVRLIENGMDLARLNFSHGIHSTHLQIIENIREAEKITGRKIAIIQDLQGPKIRTGKVENGAVELINGEQFIITAEELEIGNQQRVSTVYKELIKEVKPGNTILLDDGYLILKVKAIANLDIVTEVVKGGILKNNKGIITPGVPSTAPTLSDKDLEDLQFGLSNSIDFVALSFVRSAKDVMELKAAMKIFKRQVGIISKIERPEGYHHIEEIINESDGIMVARGDLGLELPAEDVPIIQKNIIKRCNFHGKPVIVATQMLESMINNPRPTRAEASDVANAVLDGADCVMLSGETSTGNYPFDAVDYMARIVKSVEPHYPISHKSWFVPESETHNFSDALCKASCEIANQVDAVAIISLTTGGYTPLNIAKYRPKQDIIAFTERMDTERKVALIWGVRGVYLKDVLESNEVIENICKYLLNNNILQSGSKIVFVTGTSERTILPENMIKIMKLNSD